MRRRETIGAAVNEEEKALAEKLARERRTTISGLLRELIEEEAHEAENPGDDA